jgi:hypothetical protein
MVSFRQAEAQSMKALQDRREKTRQDFFKGRQDISPNRLDRRQIQADLVEKFKQEQMKPVAGSSNLLQKVDPTGMGLAQYRQQVAQKYGPTLREIGSDIGYGIKSIGSALGQKFAAGELGIMGIAKGLYEQFTNRAAQAKDFLGQQVNKLSDIDLEILKNKNKYKLTSQKPDIQLVNQLESNAKLAAENRNFFGDYYGFGGPSMPGKVEREPMETSVPSTLYGMPQQPPGFKVMPEGQQQLLADIRKADQNMMMAQGGSVDNKLNEMQKSTNNIYGTGILSVR